MVKTANPQRMSQAISELQTALDMQDAAEKLVANRLARLATLLSPTESRRIGGRRRKSGPVLVVSNPPSHRAPVSDTAA